jgi:hypothetical protein
VEVEREISTAFSHCLARPCAGTAIPRLSQAGMPSRSEGWGGLFKDEQYRLIRSASRKSIRSLRVFEQTAPPSLRKGTPPDSGGEWSTRYIQTRFTSHPLHSNLYNAPFCRFPFILSWTRMVIDHACKCATRFSLPGRRRVWHSGRRCGEGQGRHWAMATRRSQSAGNRQRPVECRTESS